MSDTHFPFAAPPEAGTVLEVAPGVLWLRMPLPFALNHVNLFALDDGDGWVLIDTGMADAATRAAWELLLAGPLAGRPVKRIIGTHFHPDHIGLAGWLCPHLSAELWMSAGEWSLGRMLALDATADLPASQAAHYHRCGYGPDLLDDDTVRTNGYSGRVVVPPAVFHRLAEGDRLDIGGRRWQVMTFGGHSPEHVCLWCAEDHLLIAGDQVLPKISPVVGVRPYEPDARPLERFLAGLDRLAALPGDPLVLPAHGLVFSGLAARCKRLTHHHVERLDHTVTACGSGATVLEVVRALFPKARDPRMARFATDETLAHLTHLAAQGRVVRGTGPEGVWIYAALCSASSASQ